MSAPLRHRRGCAGLAAPALLLALAAMAAPAAASDWRDLCTENLDPPGLATCEAAVAATVGMPDEPAARRRLAWALLRNGQEQRGVDLFGELAALRPTDARAQFDSAAALATVWNYRAAAPFITAAVRHGGRDVATYRLAAIIYEQLARPEEAFVFHHRLARLGDSRGMFDLAGDFAGGRGTPSDPEAARAWYERAAGLGHVGAMLALAEAYRSGGLGLPPDETQAAAWEGRAAAERSAPAAGPAD